MNRRLSYLFAGIFLFVFHITAFSQNSEENVKAELSLNGGKTVYRIGESVRLTLTFSAISGKYNVLLNQDSYEYSPDEILLSPKEGVFDWAAQYARGKYFENDSFSFTDLSDQPVKIEIVLNNLYRFDKPGKYSIYVKTKRVFVPKKSFAWGTLVPLVSNVVEFEVKSMSDAEEQAEIKRLTSLIASRKNWREQDVFAEDLSFLTGDAATAEKVKQFLNSGSYIGNYQGHIRTGLLLAPNKLLAIKLLEDALRDPNREVNSDLPYILTELRMLQENTGLPPDTETDLKKIREQKEKRSSEILQAYYRELFESLPKRSGKSKLVAAFTIFTQNLREKVTSEAFTASKNILIENFDDLSISGKSYLLENAWEKIKTPALLPAIEKILAVNEPDPYSNLRNAALKRLFEFDEKKARPVLIDEIRKPDSRIQFDVLSLLPDKFLPEADDALLEQIRNLAPTKDYRLKQKNMLAARYATKKIYQELMTIYKTSSGQWTADVGDGLLVYFARHNEKEAVSLIEERLAKSGDKSGSSVFYNLTKSSLPELPAGIEKILQKRAENNEPATAMTAVYYLSKYGGKQNRKLLEKRHNRWLKEWRARGAELNDPNADAQTKAQAQLQIELIESLIKAKSWKLSDTEISQLKLMCVSQTCRQRLPRR